MSEVIDETEASPVKRVRGVTHAGQRTLGGQETLALRQSQDIRMAVVNHQGLFAGFHDALYRNDDLDQQEATDFRGIAVFLTKPLT